MDTTLPTMEPASEHEGKPGSHLLAFLGGVVVLLLGFRGSLGAGVLAPLAMLPASGLWERRGRRLSPSGHWVVALCVTAIAYVLFSGIVTRVTSEQSWSHMRRAADSLRMASAKQKLPEWLQRLTPRTTAAPTSERAQTMSIAFGAALGAFFFVGLYGSIAWAGATMLVGYGVNGHWPGSDAAAPPGDSGSSSLA